MLNFEQNITTLSKILSIIGKKELPERKIGEKKSKIGSSLTMVGQWYDSYSLL